MSKNREVLHEQIHKHLLPLLTLSKPTNLTESLVYESESYIEEKKPPTKTEQGADTVADSIHRVTAASKELRVNVIQLREHIKSLTTDCRRLESQLQ